MSKHVSEIPRKQPKHRSENPADPTNTGPLQMAPRTGSHTGAYQGKNRKAVAITTGGLLLTGLASAAGATPAQPIEAKSVSADTQSLSIITADSSATLRPATVSVDTSAAPPEAAPPPAPAPAAVAPAPPPPAPPAPVQAPAPAPVVQRAAPVAPPPPKPSAPPPIAGRGAAIAAAALSQLGRNQDCTALVTNSLAAVGIHFHGWPAGYLSLGTQVSASQAQPGDLAYYANGGMGLAHIAVYIGNGVAVHGGWNGNTTVTFSVNIGSGPVFIRV